MHLLVLFDNSMRSKSLIQHPVITIWILWSLRYRSFCNQCFAFCVFYFGVHRQPIFLLWGQISMQCLDYPIYKTKNWWLSIDSHFQDGVTKLLCTLLAEMAATTLHMHYCYKATLRLPKMQDQKLLRLHWGSIWGWCSALAGVVFANNGD